MPVESECAHAGWKPRQYFMNPLIFASVKIETWIPFILFLSIYSKPTYVRDCVLACTSVPVLLESTTLPLTPAKA